MIQWQQFKCSPLTNQHSVSLFSVLVKKVEYCAYWSAMTNQHAMPLFSLLNAKKSGIARLLFSSGGISDKFYFSTVLFIWELN